MGGGSAKNKPDALFPKPQILEWSVESFRLEEYGPPSGNPDGEYEFKRTLLSYSNHLNDLKAFGNDYFAFFTTIQNTDDPVPGETGSSLFLRSSNNVRLFVDGSTYLILEDGTKIYIHNLFNMITSGCSYWNRTVKINGKTYYVKPATDDNPWKYTEKECKYNFPVSLGYAGSGWYYGGFNIFGVNNSTLLNEGISNPLQSYFYIGTDTTDTYSNKLFLPTSSAFSFNYRYDSASSWTSSIAMQISVHNKFNLRFIAENELKENSACPTLIFNCPQQFKINMLQ